MFECKVHLLGNLSKREFYQIPCDSVATNYNLIKSTIHNCHALLYLLTTKMYSRFCFVLPPKFAIESRQKFLINFSGNKKSVKVGSYGNVLQKVLKKKELKS